MKFSAMLVVFLGFLFMPLIPAVAEPIPENGILREHYDNGQLKLENVYKKGIVVRKRTFYENGQLLSEYRYKEGKLYLFRTYYENGNLKSLWTKKSGKTRFYYPNGNLRAVQEDR